MNKKEIFKEIIKNFQDRSLKGIKPRDVILPLASGKIITVSGVRRSGKTYLLMDAVKKLIKKGISFKQIVFINFEDERLEIEKNDFDLIIKAYQELYSEQDISKVYFFFDEIQNIEGWEKFTRRIYDSVSTHIFITGSNAKFLSRDISTTLRGRSLNYEVFPLSFPEFLEFLKISPDIHSSKNRAKIAAKSKDYLLNGGFPELLSVEKSFFLKTLQEYFDVMLFKDIIERYKRKTHAHLLKYFIKRLLSSISTPVSIYKIYNELKSQGYKIDKNLLYELIEELNSIYLFFPLHKYSASPIKREMSEKKFYIVDNGLANAVSFNLSENKGNLLENAVFMRLYSMGFLLYFYKNRKECDFVRIRKDGKKEVYQVCYDLSDEVVKQREFAGLIEACLELKIKSGYVISMSEEFEKTISGVKIKVIPFYKWVLEI